jgi:hypothetical protein
MRLGHNIGPGAHAVCILDRFMHKLYPRASSLVLALSFCLRMVPSALAQAPPPTNSQTETIQGTVVNSVTDEPIGRALVYSPDHRFATMTDSEGHFSFTFPAPSTVEANSGFNPSGSRVSPRAPSRPETLEAKKPGFLDSRRIEKLSADKELTISLIPEAVITGRVVLPSSDAPDRIELELYRQWVQDGRAYWGPTGRIATTRSNGEFRFHDLSSGTYKLLTRELQDNDPLTFDPHGQLYGYPVVYFPNALDFASAQTIQLAAGQTFQGADISLVRRAYYPVKVALENVQTGLMMQLRVYAEGRGPGYKLGYNRKEHAIVGTLPNGNYTLEVSTFELAGFKESGTGLLTISVKGGAVEGPRLAVVPNGSITVVVTEDFTTSGSPNGRPPDSQNLARTPGSEDSTVLCREGGQCETLRGPSSYLNIRFEPDAVIFDPEFEGAADTAALLSRIAGPEGKSFVIEHVRPGRYWIRLDSRRGYPARITCGGVDLEHQPLVIGAGGSSTQIEVTMRDDGAEVEGTVDGMAKTPSDTGDSATVYLMPLPDGGGDYREVQVSPEGKFNFEQVPPGLYEALAFDQPHPALEYRNAEAMRAYESKGQVVRLSAGQKEQLRLQVISTSE